MITDDMYLELTPEDTVNDIQNLLIGAIPGFEIPRVNLYDYSIKIDEIKENELTPDDFLLGVVWEDSIGDLDEIPTVLVERSAFNIQ